MEQLKNNLKEVERRIEQACIRSGRKREEVTLIAVSKTKPISMIETVYKEGIFEFGENKVQELCEKAACLPEKIHWHMIGHLQRNKVKQVIQKACLIHSVDSIRLAEQIEQEAKKLGKEDVWKYQSWWKPESGHGKMPTLLYSNIMICWERWITVCL